MPGEPLMHAGVGSAVGSQDVRACAKRPACAGMSFGHVVVGNGTVIVNVRVRCDGKRTRLCALTHVSAGDLRLVSFIVVTGEGTCTVLLAVNALSCAA